MQATKLAISPTITTTKKQNQQKKKNLEMGEVKGKKAKKRENVAYW